MKTSYSNNVYHMLRRRGLAEKYEHAGIYCIKIGEQIVYIGKSENMLRRVSAHYVGIKCGSELKYRILQEASRKGKDIGFDVLYYAKSDDIENEIGEMEGKFIREYRPILNTQIPKEGNWHTWDTEMLDVKNIFKQIFDEA